MSINSINNTLIPNILTNSKFRIFRHVVLLFIISIIASGINVSGEYKSNFYQYYEWLVFFILFAGVIYLNMYVLVPRFLLKNRSTVYFKLLFVCILTLLLLTSLSQFVFHYIDWSKGMNYGSLFFSFTNSILAFGIIIICSSTFILLKNWIINNKRISELETTTLNAELQQLKNQINPHFLFNMLNNANIMVKHNPTIASEMLFKLDALLCYQIEDSAKDKVLLADDILFLTDYLELEKSRRDRFEYTISKEGEMENVKIPPLLFIPFVENAVKHSPENKNISYVNISFRIKDGLLLFLCMNSKPKVPLAEKAGGLGLMNIKRRLELLYRSNYSLELNETETTYTVHLELKL